VGKPSLPRVLSASSAIQGGIDPLRELRAAPGLGATDKAIVYLLQQDGRASMSEISRQVGLTTKAASRRVMELVSTGVIDITAVTNPEALGYHAGALLGIEVTPGAELARVAERLWADDRLDYLSVVGGRFRLIAEILARDYSDLRAAIEQDISQVPGVASVELFPYLSVYYQRFNVDRADQASGSLAPPVVRAQERELDEMDHDIIAQLNYDGRRGFQSVADQLGVSESQVRRRVWRMVDAGILRIMAMANPTSLGYKSLAWLAIRASTDEQVRTVAGRLAEIPGVTYIVIASGTFDLFVDLVARDPDDLMRLLDEEVRAVSGVEYLETWLHLDLHWRPPRPLGALRSRVK
jgi:Lrp/AsnC family transcriptional regulator for asnA, asnC and gidA